MTDFSENYDVDPNRTPLFHELPEVTDVPTRLDRLPDGTEVAITGDVERWEDLGHLQGHNALGFEGTCGLVSCEQLLRMYGLDVNEDAIVRYAAEHHLCTITDNPARSGGTTPAERIELLQELGVPAHIEEYTTLEDIAGFIDEGRGVMVRVNAGVLWDNWEAYENGQPNHAVVVTGVARDPNTGEVKGVFINDSGSGKVGQYIDRELFETACPGYLTIVSDVALT